MALALGPSVERKFNKTFSRQESTSHMNMITHYQNAFYSDNEREYIDSLYVLIISGLVCSMLYIESVGMSHPARRWRDAQEQTMQTKCV